jgi:non-ribosomal peptide synthetase component E (peptide arylation enzyme)
VVGRNIATRRPRGPGLPSVPLAEDEYVLVAAPAEEVENFVYQVPSVSQVAAVAMPDPELGERVCLYVVPRPGTTVTLEEIRVAMEDRGVARFKLPERLVLVEELVSTKVGKIDKKALRADIAERLSTRVTA